MANIYSIFKSRKTDWNKNFNCVFHEEYRGFFGKEWWVSVFVDKDERRLVKCVNGAMVAELRFPCNWTDEKRGDSRRWVLKHVTRHARSFYPKIDVAFQCERTGRWASQRF